MLKNDFYEENLKNLPVSFKKLVGSILEKHRGEEFAISRNNLVFLVSKKLKKGDLSKKQLANLDRAVRKAIEFLRFERGWLIGSLLDGGYYICQTRTEYEVFKSQYCSPAYQQLQNISIMDGVARQRFGDTNPGGQLPLIEGEGVR
jgi:hypothetical protein